MTTPSMFSDRDVTVTADEAEATLNAVQKAEASVQKARQAKLVEDLTLILAQVEQVQYDRKIGIEKREKEIADRKANLAATTEAKAKLVDAVNNGSIATRYELQRFLAQNPDVTKALTSAAACVAGKFEG